MFRALASQALLLVLAGGSAQLAAQQPPTNAPYGPRFDLPAGQRPETWNPAKRKLMEGGPLIGGTVRVADPRAYCAMANAGYDFTWVEMQHEAITWEQAARMWRTCPGAAVPGARVAYADEREIQHATDTGALVVVVPTIDTVEEAQEAINWTYFPPLGRRSNGGGQGPSEIWNRVPGGYRQTWNDNVVLILMIETLEGVKNARAIARLPGVTALFAASGDLGNFSGWQEGDPQYEALVTEVEAAAREAGVHVCGPLRWANRPAFSCFQAGTEDANIRRGAQAEIQQAVAQYGRAGGARPAAGAQSGRAAGGAAAGAPPAPTATAASALLSDLTASCGTITYEADCFAVVQRVADSARTLSAGDRSEVVRRLTEIVARNPGQAARIREIAARGGLNVGP
jgi:2-keto-3-deoxy-L-rhamnonate aldolase RhmA